MELVRAWCAYFHVRGRALRGEQGAINVEYALLTALIAAACIGAVGYFGLSLKTYILEAVDKL